MMMSIPFTVQILKLSHTKIAAQKGYTRSFPKKAWRESLLTEKSQNQANLRGRTVVVRASLDTLHSL